MARRLYRAAYFTPLRPALEHRVVQRMRARLALPMGPADVIETLDALALAGVPSWLAGGWGIEALAGTQTRPHKDLDLLIDREHAETAEAVLAARGYRRIPESLPGTRRLVPGSLMPNRVFLRDPEGRTVDVHPVDVASWPDLPSVPEPFAVGTVGDREVGCLSLSAQAAAHQGYAIPEEQRADVELLERMLAAASAASGGDGVDAPA